MILFPFALKDSPLFLCLLDEPYSHKLLILACYVLRNKFNFWSVHEIMNSSGLVQSK